MYRVPFVDPREHYRRFKDEIDFAITDTLARGDLVVRQQLRDFERHFADFVGVKYAVGVNSGYHALHFSLVAAGVGPGDQVITVAHTFPATISAIVHTGATPVLIDVGPDFNLNPVGLEKAVTPRTKAIIPVHLNGRLCDMDQVQEVASRHRLLIVEDAAQALGARFKGRMAGSFGLAGCFSFYPFKTLGGLGDGGAITTNDAEVARMATLLRFNGEDRETDEFICHGYTALLDNVNAAVLDRKLTHLSSWVEHRRAVAERYRRGLRGLRDLTLPHFAADDYVDSYQAYVVRSPERDHLQQHLFSRGIETMIHWPRPVWTHKGLALEDPPLPETVRVCHEVLSLPMYSEITFEQVEIVVEAVREFFARQ